jgi:hypothetical protein
VGKPRPSELATWRGRSRRRCGCAPLRQSRCSGRPRRRPLEWCAQRTRPTLGGRHGTNAQVVDATLHHRACDPFFPDWLNVGLTRNPAFTGLQHPRGAHHEPDPPHEHLAGDGGRESSRLYPSSA